MKPQHITYPIWSIWNDVNIINTFFLFSFFGKMSEKKAFKKQTIRISESIFIQDHLIHLKRLS